MSNSQSRKWTLVINNPLEYSLTREVMIEKITRFSPEYFCIADEIATTGTYHTHIFIYSPSPIRFTTLKDRFPIAHIEKAYGSAKSNMEYISKSGEKWSTSEKAETSVEGSFYEWGKMPPERAEKNPINHQLIQDLNDGRTTAEIVVETPNLAFKVKEIDALRQTLLSESKGTLFRELDVAYIFGSSGTGKTKSIYQQHRANDICRITNYRNGRGVYFDAYCGQDVLVFEEFNSQVNIEEMLNYLDIYPLLLPARYNDKIAVYTKVFITSNIPLSDQFVDVQLKYPETYRALLRRIHRVIEYCEDGRIIEYSNAEMEDNCDEKS